jgi:O-antigen/teichoic acid export membrane protein
MVSLWVGIETVGHFAAATKIMEVGLIPGDLFAQLLMTRIAFSFNAQGDRDPNRFGAWYQILFAMIVPACIGVWVFADVILQCLFGPAFAGSAWILRILMIYLLVETADNVMSVILQAAHKQREDANRLAFNPLTNIVLNLLLLPMLGAIGAATGRVGGVAASATLRYILMARELHAVNWLRFAIKPGLISAVVVAVCYAASDLARPIWLLAFYIVATAVVLIATGAFSIPAIRDMMTFPTSDD